MYNAKTHLGQLLSKSLDVIHEKEMWAHTELEELHNEDVTVVQCSMLVDYITSYRAEFDVFLRSAVTDEEKRDVKLVFIDYCRTAVLIQAEILE